MEGESRYIQISQSIKGRYNLRICKGLEELEMGKTIAELANEEIKGTYLMSVGDVKKFFRRWGTSKEPNAQGEEFRNLQKKRLEDFERRTDGSYKRI